jgi:hypothetical protein
MPTAELIYNQNERNMKLREKIENEMFINRSVSQESAYDYITKPKLIEKNKSSVILPILVVIGFLTYFGSLILTSSGKIWRNNQ